MNKRGAYACPMPECRKTGNVSGLVQHFASKHPELGLTATQIRNLIEKGENVTMSYQNDYRDGDPGGSNRSVWTTVAVVVVALGIALGGLWYWGVDPLNDAPEPATTGTSLSRPAPTPGR